MDTEGAVARSWKQPGGSMHELGNTPLQALALVIAGATRIVHLKLEAANPTGSVKDRTGYALLRDLQERRRLRRGGVVIESTSGNLGVALAALCQTHGYGFVAVVDPKTTEENLARMRALGAKIELVEQPDATGGYLLSRLGRVQALCQRFPDYAWTDQYANPSNPLIHYTTTGPEIYTQMRKKVGALFVPVSTGGTLAGIGRYFREVSPATRIIGVDARGSVVFGAPAGPRKLTGVGSSRPSSFLSCDLYNEYMLVSDEEAFAFCRFLAATTGLLVGGSSGATLAACTRFLAVHPEVHDVVCLCADRGEHYASSIFSDSWLQRQGLTLSRKLLEPVQEISIVAP